MPETAHTAPSAIRAPADRSGRAGLPRFHIRALIALLALDAALIAAHGLTGLLLERTPPLLNISLDFSIAEWIGYGKWLAIVLCLASAWRHGRCAIMLPLAGLFAVMLLDDSMQLHEGLGRLLVEAGLVPAPGPLHEQDLGELLGFVVIGLPLLPALALGWMRSDAQARRRAVTILGMVAVLSVFGGLVDTLHPLLPQGRIAVALAHIVEDGGEMIVASLILAHVLVIRASVLATPRRAHA